MPEKLPTALLIFIKNPELGQVKTRLAAKIGQPAALAVYHKLLQHTREVVQEIPFQRYLFYSKYVPEQDEWPPHQFIKLIQEGSDLGDRMQRAFQEVLSRGHEKAIIIGSDCPQLQTQHLLAAETALDTHNFAIGPAQDGGYYLLGLKQIVPQIFANKPWSSSQVRSLTLQDLVQKQQSYSLLEELSDIDQLEDLEKFPQFKS